MFSKAAIALFALLPLLASATPIKRQGTLQYKLISSGRDGGCLSLPGGISDTPYDGAPIVSVSCSIASAWDIDASQTGSFVLSGTNYALDIGLNPTNNGALKVWTSYPGSPQQTWSLNSIYQLKNDASGQCVDEGDNGAQTYQCFDDNSNQKWYLSNKPGSPSSYPTTTTSASSTSAPSSSSTSTPPFTGVQVHTNGDSTQCLTVQGGYNAIGSAVAISDCFSTPDGSVSPFQAWVLPNGGTGPVRIKSSANDGSYLCLDAGNNPADGSGMKVWTCYDGLLQQTWSYTKFNQFSLSNNQCLDVRKESTPSYSKPYISNKDVQTWTCSYDDPYQHFNF